MYSPMENENGLGDRLHSLLDSMGINPNTIEAWLGRPCGCEERRQKLNQLGFWTRRVLSGKIEQAKRFLFDMIEGK